MKKKISLLLAIVCIALFGWCWLKCDSEEFVEVPQEFIDLVDNALIDPLAEFKEGTFVLAFHDAQAGVDEETLRQFKANQAADSKQFVKIDVNVQESLARKYHVQNTPAYMVMKNGRVVLRTNTTGADQQVNVYSASHPGSQHHTSSNQSPRSLSVTQ